MVSTSPRDIGLPPLMYLSTRGSLSRRSKSSKSDAVNSRIDSRGVRSRMREADRAIALILLRAFAQLGQLLGLVFLRQRLGQLEQIAIHDRVDLVEREVDAVIGHPPLREVIRANALAAIA